MLCPRVEKITLFCIQTMANKVMFLLFIYSLFYVKLIVNHQKLLFMLFQHIFRRFLIKMSASTLGANIKLPDFPRFGDQPAPLLCTYRFFLISTSRLHNIGFKISVFWNLFENRFEQTINNFQFLQVKFSSWFQRKFFNSIILVLINFLGKMISR